MIRLNQEINVLFKPDLNYFKFNLPKDAAVLNFGCGGRKEESEVGVDISVGTAADYIVLPGENLPFENEMFDLVYSRFVLEHIIDLDHLIKEIYRVLKPGGSFRFCVPHAYSMDMYDDPTHCRFFTTRTIR